MTWAFIIGGDKGALQEGTAKISGSVFTDLERHLAVYLNYRTEPKMQPATLDKVGIDAGRYANGVPQV